MTINSFRGRVLSPASQAFSDFVDGLGIEDNPYPEGSHDHSMYLRAMQQCFRAYDENEASKYVHPEVAEIA